MKKTLALALSLLGLLSSCSSSSNTPTSSQTSITPSGDIDGSKILVVYFSWSSANVTQGIAEKLSASTGGTLVEIVPETPYTTNYTDVIEIGRTEKANNARPAISTSTYNSINMDNYTTVFIGFPIWWYCEPMIIRTFIEHYEGLAGKTIYPFSTSSSSGATDAVNNIRTACPSATVTSNIHFTSTSLSRADSSIATWLNEITLPTLPAIGEENEAQ